MTDYLKPGPMVFKARPGEKITDLKWEVATGQRCADCLELLKKRHKCGKKGKKRGQREAA